LVVCEAPRRNEREFETLAEATLSKLAFRHVCLKVFKDRDFIDNEIGMVREKKM
jgi:hypothetical protein